MPKKPKGEAPKSEQLLRAEIEAQKELKRRKLKIKEEIYPILLDSSYFDASNFLSGVQQVIRAVFMDDMRYKKFHEYAMKTSIESPYPGLTDKIIDLLKDESLESGLYMLSQTEQAIGVFKENETKERKIGSYKADFTV